MKAIYNYNQDTKIATFKLFDKGDVYKAECRPSKADFPYASEYAGLYVAEMKARIERARKKVVALDAEIEKTVTQIQTLAARESFYIDQYEDLNSELKEFLDEKDQLYKKLAKINQNK